MSLYFDKYKIYWLFIIVGCFLRVLWPTDMEWKFDQMYMFDQAMKVVNTGVWPQIGMPSGGGISNPALGMWIFSLLGFLFKTPVSMMLSIAFLNIFAILLFVVWGVNRFKDQLPTQSLIIQTGALVSVSPLAILFSRNIWAQDLLPIFSVIFIIAIFERRSYLGSFMWGLVGAFLGQIHMPGYFFAFGVVLYFLYHDIKFKIKTQWGMWLIGSAIGALPLIPWLVYMLNLPEIVATADAHNSGTIEFKHIFKFRFYLYMILESLGIHMKYSIGKQDFWMFMKEPFGTYFVTMLHAALTSIGLYALFNWVKTFKDKSPYNKTILQTSNAVWLGAGGVMTLIGLKLHPHYIIVAFPFSYLFMTIALRKIKPVFHHVFLVCHLLVSISFMTYIHVNDGASSGDYGKTYKSQIK